MSVSPDVWALADRIAIQDLIARYAVLVDTQQWAALGELFAEDAEVDFTALGGPAGDVPSLLIFLEQMLPGFRRTQHLMGLPVIDLDGDIATARTPCLNPMVIDGRDGAVSAWLIGLWYDDTFRRTADGWLFAKRVQDRCYSITDLRDTNLG